MVPVKNALVASVILPAFNEVAGVKETVESTAGILRDAGYVDFEILVVDDGSADDTAKVAETSGARVIRNLQNMGYGYSLKRGIREASHDIIVIADADSTYPVREIPRMVELHKQGYHMVVGQRTGFRDRPVKMPLRLVLRWLVEFTTGRRIPDANSGFRVFSRNDILPHLDRLSDKYSFTTTMTVAYMLCHLYVIYVPVEYRKRTGHTTVSVFRDTLQTFQFIVQTILFYNPIKIFLASALLIAVPSIALIVVGFALGGPLATFAGVLGLLTAALVVVLGFLSEQLRQILIISDDK